MTDFRVQLPIDELRRLVSSGASLVDAARQRQMPYPQLKEQCVQAGLTLPRPGNRTGRTRYPQLTEKFLRREYVDGRRTVVSIAAEVGCGEKLVRDALARGGIATRGRGRRQAPAALTEAYLREHYLTRRKTMTEIAATLGTTVTTVSDHLDRFGIPARPAQANRRRQLDTRKLQKLFTAGTSYRQMAAALGVSVGKVYATVGAHGWTR